MGFEHVMAVDVEGLVPFEKFCSSETGMTVVVAQVDGPLVHGYFVLATEAGDDDGLPHTLEHLVFLGSEKYPYKGVLDKLANRCLARGTNAWTDVDHTCYTIDTAGKEGFLTVLPMYLDHILNPTLTESGFVTEVHHINGDGEDAGVVYSEMQGRENTGPSRARRAIALSLYGEPGTCGFSSETGGMMANLRELNNQMVRDYHRAFYRPENLCIVVTGNVTSAEVLGALEPVEDDILRRRQKKGAPLEYCRPWSKEIPPIPEPGKCVKSVFPSDDESVGSVYFAWRGPPWQDNYSCVASTVMLRYLCEGATSPLRSELVECPDPVCGDVSYWVEDRKVRELVICIDDVPIARVDDVHERVRSVFDKTCCSIDMKRLRTVVKRLRRQYLSRLEESPADVIAFPIIADFLYGDADGQNLKLRFNLTSTLAKLTEEDESFWTSTMMGIYFRLDFAITVDSIPSAEEGERVRETERQRLEVQHEALGSAQLRELAAQLDSANKENSRPIPEGIISSVPVPAISKVSLIGIETLIVAPGREITISRPDLFPMNPYLDKAPFTLQFDHIRSSFVELTVALSSASLKENLRMYIPIFLDIIMETAIEKNGSIMNYDVVVSRLLDESVFNDVGIGFGGSSFSFGSFSQALVLELKFELGDFSCAVEWLYDILRNTKFSADRLKVATQRLLAAVPSTKRSGSGVSSALMAEIVFDRFKGCNKSVLSPIRHGHFLQLAHDLLESDPVTVVSDICNLRNQLLEPQNLFVHVSGDCSRMTTLVPEGLAHLLSDGEARHKNELQKPVPYSGSYGLGKCDNSESRFLIAGLDAIESSFLTLVTKGIPSFGHPDEAPLRVLFEYLTALEGPMWTGIRGLGLAYSYSLSVSPEENAIVFTLYRSSQLVSAYQASIEMLTSFKDGSSSFDPKGIEAAKAGVAYSLIQRQSSGSSAAQQNFLSRQFRGIDGDYAHQLFPRVEQVTEQDLTRVLETYLARALRGVETRISVACPALKVDEIASFFHAQGYTPEKIDCLDQFFAL
mmetsp:Transcript_12821/g.26017  ORF Transcript_12821/g.26017 Transcript_12821/m.26017 type:complete len:1025 (-) Transcript_12821:1513-4587(-)